jgi:hypothetical protein
MVKDQFSGIADGANATNGQESPVPIVVGMWKCDGTVGSALPAGKYGVVVATGTTRRQVPRYVSAEVPLTITNR